MSKDKPTLLDWLGPRREPDFSSARWLGGLISIVTTILLALFLGGAIVAFLKAVFGGDPQGVALRNTGLVLAAVVGAPFLVWRSVVAQKQVDVAEEALFNDKINAAASDLHARRLVTQNPGDADNHWDYWQDDIVKRNAAIDRLEGLAIERPDLTPRIARMLSIYLRELSAENTAQPVPEVATLEELWVWAVALRACRSDMENAAQTLGRLQRIGGVDTDEVKIDLRGANLQGFDLGRSSFKKAWFEGAEMQGARLNQAELQGANLSTAQIQGAFFSGARMQRANLSGAKILMAILSNAKMQEAYLNGAEMQGASLNGANMQNANFGGAKMDAATSFRAAILSGAALKEVDHTDTNLSQAQVDDLFYDGSVTFGANITRAPGRDEVLEWEEFQIHWHAWQKSNGYVPD